MLLERKETNQTGSVLSPKAAANASANQKQSDEDEKVSEKK